VYHERAPQAPGKNKAMRGNGDKRYLLKRRQVWYLRMRVPDDLQAKMGKSEIVQSLGTRDLSVAQDRRWDRVAEVKRYFAGLRGDPEAERRAERDEFQRQLEAWREAVTEATARGEQITGYHEDWMSLEGMANKTVHDGADGWPGAPPQGSPAWEAALHFLQELNGKRPELPARYRMTFDEAAKGYLAEHRRDPKARLTGQTLGQAEAVFRLFNDYCRGRDGRGDDTLGSITKERAARFLDDVARLSPTWGRSPKTKTRSFWQLLAMYPAGDGGGLSNKTLNRYSSSLAAVFKWTEKRGTGRGKTRSEGSSGRRRAIGRRDGFHYLTMRCGRSWTTAQR
jgi:hypothetical protein